MERLTGITPVDHVDHPNSIDQDGLKRNRRYPEGHTNGQWSSQETTRWKTMSRPKRDGFGSLTAALEALSPSITSRNSTNGDCHQSARKIRDIPIWERVPGETVEELIVLACRAPLPRTSSPPLQVSSADK